ncbi:tRNA adenosine(34) deaminase TadA [Heyndrickxia oleronia]|uniref:tRNA adenosine(34) deaminase TadA n=1 Tax=Heyndrickxia oleronia TaxID=38875 RepID=UPI00217D4099|nr:tRNA adenosine(34) deaminase TadA [Heyndrickxia oleronia]MCI1593342.1 tRNA adenosine(34) deaminase TadA [Heyndrickxia oleronia]MCI1615855.1 tRNA adenosine(34) deaminase TadA [Heyndrickxia oleronia]MCI1746452.1 tRNA adenosine(34) deaminase TadA [Heyndrickxia oleronia]MCI1764251.1 tRNA adenosine(34) deaminase TadA [Heyndrickxia oleronia]
MVKNADEYFMKLAISEAKKAEEKCEVPIGAVVVLNGEVIATAHNLRESTQNAITHAEILAIQKACEKIGSWRLEDAELYVTLEPCPMCSGAIILSRIKKVIFGAHDPKAGCAGTLMNLLDDQRFNHQSEVVSGVLENECSVLLSDFFRNIRKRNKVEKEKRKITESSN